MPENLNLSNLQPEVARYEPATALVAGDDGLAVVRRLVPEAAARLKPGGWLMVEIGFGQADRVRALFGKASRMELEVIQPDLQGIPRVAVARRSEH